MKEDKEREAKSGASSAEKVGYAGSAAAGVVAHD